MAGTQEARLNLVLSARDNASKVVNKFVNNIRKSFEELNTALKEGINSEAIVGSIREIGSATNSLRNEVESSFNAIRENADSTFNNIARQVEESFNAIRRNVEGTVNSMSSSFDRAKIHMEEMANAAKDIKAKLDFAGLQMAGQMLEDFGRRGVGFFVSAAKSAADFDQEIQNTLASMKSLDPTLQINTRLFNSLKNEALELGTKGFYSANQVAQAMNTLARQGIKGEEAIKAATETVHNAAAANFEDLEHTANVVSDIFHEFGDQIVHDFGGNVQKAFQYIGDNMTSTLHRARLSMDDYLNTLKYVGPLASKAGWSLRDTSQAIALLAEHGIKGSQAGTTLRRMLTDLTPTTAKAKQEMKDLGLITADGTNQFYKAGGKLKSFTEIAQILHDHLTKLPPDMETMALKTLFGQYALAGMATIANTSNKELKDLTDNFGKTGTAADVMNEKAKGFGAEMRKLSSTFDTFKKDIGDKLKGPITAIIEVLTRLMKAFMGLPEPIQKGIVTFAAVASVVALVGGAFMAAVGTIGLFATSFGEGMAVLGAVLPELGLVAAAIAGVIAVVAGLAYAWTHNLGNIQQKTKPILDFLGNEFRKAWNTIVNTVQSGVKALQQWWAKIGPDAQKAFDNIWQALVKLKPVWQTAWEGLKFVVSLVWDTIIGTIRDAWGFISGIFQLFVHLVNGQWSKAWQDFKQVVWNALMLVIDFFDVRWVGAVGRAVARVLSHLGIFKKDGVKAFEGFMKDGLKICEDLFKYLGKLFGDGFKDILKIVKDGWKFIQDLWKTVSSLLHGDTKGFWQNLRNLFNDGVKWVLDIIRGWFRTMDNLFGQLPGKALKWATDHMRSFARGISSHVGDVIRGITGLIHNIASEMEKLPGQAWKWASNMMHQFANGIESFAGRIKNAVMNIANYIKDHLGHFSPAKKGPLSTDDKWFPNMMKMFAEGIEANRPGIQKALGKVAMDVQANFSPDTGTIAQQLKAINQLFDPKKVIERDPFLEAESRTAYDRIAGHTRNIPHTTTMYDRVAGHTRNIPHTTSLYDRVMGHSAHHVVINVHIEGRSKETDRQLLQQLENELGRKFRTHLPMRID